MQINLDFETYSECDIRKAGAWAYSCHASTEVICMAYSIDGAPPVLWLPSMGAPAELFAALQRGAMLHAWNSFFELSIWRNVLEWPDLPISQMTDTAALASMLALPRALGDCGAALGIAADQVKDKRGRYLIQRLCKPYRGQRCRDPELLRELYAYCQQDVIAEQAIAAKLLPISVNERAVWELDQKINIRGVYIDAAAVDDALHLIDVQTDRLNTEVYAITKGALENVSQRAKVMNYIAGLGYDMDCYTAGYIETVLKDANLPAQVRRLLEIRQQTGKTSTAKYQALKEIVTPDSRAHGLLMYHGASTGRWTGKHFQPQNLPRPSARFEGSEAQAVELIRSRDADLLTMVFDDPMDALSGAIRGMITAPPGKRLLIADYSAIEARALPWLAGQHDVLDVFRSHGKIYEYTASQIYGLPWREIGKDSPERFVGKVATLALGYGGGAKAFAGMAQNYGVDIPEELAEKIKTDWRKANDNIVRFWWNCEAAALRAVQKPGVTFEERGVSFRVVRGFLFCKLPSGRLLAYYAPKIEPGRFGNDQVTYMGVNSVTRKWERQSTYGGKLVENITQAVARDVMASAMLRLHAAGYEIVLTVHDEIIAEADNDFGNIEEFKRIMCELPTWTEGLPLAASGFEAERYRK